MHDFTFTSDDVAETEAFLTEAYAPMRLERVGHRVDARLRRRSTPQVCIDEAAFDFDLRYDAAPLGRVCLCLIHSGVISQDTAGEETRHYLPGEIVSLTPPHLPYSGVARRATYSVILLDPALLVDLDGEPTELVGDRPRSAGAAGRLQHTVAWMRDHVLTGDQVSPLVQQSATRALAAAVLDAFTHTSQIDAPTRAMPDTVRRAMVFIEAEAGSPIGLDDIARSARVTPRALQYAFRRHLDVTPLQHLRTVRLDRVRAALLAPDAHTTVTAVASRWGFAHLGHFGTAYRRAYGETPGATLDRAHGRRPAVPVRAIA